MKKVHSVQAMSVDTYVTHGKIDFSAQKDPDGSQVSFNVSNLGISAIVVIE
jgi:hypothetical protein